VVFLEVLKAFVWNSARSRGVTQLQRIYFLDVTGPYSFGGGGGEDFCLRLQAAPPAIHGFRHTGFPSNRQSRWLSLNKA